MKVWIDQDLCTGDGLCVEIVPPVFEMHDDGLAYVKAVGQAALVGADGEPIHRGQEGLVEVPRELEESVIEASEECPGECIFIESE
jgi:ferredoxin